MVIVILGDPYSFSIIVSVVDEWNIDQTFTNGILIFCIDEKLFPKEVISIALSSELWNLKEKLKNLTTNQELFNMPKDKAFTKIYNITFPDDINIDNDYSFDISPESFSDKDYFVFAVKSNKRVRIMASKLNYITEDSRHDLENLNVSETFIDADALNKIILGVESFKGKYI